MQFHSFYTTEKWKKHSYYIVSLHEAFLEHVLFIELLWKEQ